MCVDITICPRILFHRPPDDSSCGTTQTFVTTVTIAVICCNKYHNITCELAYNTEGTFTVFGDAFYTLLLKIKKNENLIFLKYKI